MNQVVFCQGLSVRVRTLPSHVVGLETILRVECIGIAEAVRISSSLVVEVATSELPLIPDAQRCPLYRNQYRYCVTMISACKARHTNTEGEADEANEPHLTASLWERPLYSINFLEGSGFYQILYLCCNFRRFQCVLY